MRGCMEHSRRNNVQFLLTQKDIFNLFIIHQNRVKHGEKSYIKTEFIPTFMDLVFWGHEHDNQIIPTNLSVASKPIYITQPGSTVPTSLCEGEAGEKNVGVLYVKAKEFKFDPQYISAQMDNLLDKVKRLFPDNNKEPLIRIRVSISKPYNQNTVKRDFLAKYSSKVANPGEVLLFSKNRRSGPNSLKKIHLKIRC